jgi:hypothetical protein
MLDALAAGEDNPEERASMAKGKPKSKLAELRSSRGVLRVREATLDPSEAAAGKGYLLGGQAGVGA